MNITKSGNLIHIELDDEENSAINFLVKFRGAKGLKDSLQAWLNTRIDTAKEEERRSVHEIFKKMNQEEKAEFLARRQLQGK